MNFFVLFSFGFVPKNIVQHGSICGNIKILWKLCKNMKINHLLRVENSLFWIPAFVFKQKCIFNQCECLLCFTRWKREIQFNFSQKFIKTKIFRNPKIEDNPHHVLFFSSCSTFNLLILKMRICKVNYFWTASIV